ncbi:MAG TPA: cupin domain-containing protein [Steroidobacteraceae bacterium]|nr:cupin domain-containing protein [Steroidobacteraceae bacterium]
MRGVEAARMLRQAALGMLALLPAAVMGNSADPATMAAPSAPRLITPLKDAPLVQDDDVKCLQSALENGDPDTGPSTFLLKAPARCRVAAHYHSAEEQMIVIQGQVLTGMKGMRSVTLTAGGVAVMPSKAVHWFSCRGKEPCLMVVTFNQKYDIVWAEARR